MTPTCTLLCKQPPLLSKDDILMRFDSIQEYVECQRYGVKSLKDEYERLTREINVLKDNHRIILGEHGNISTRLTECNSSLGQNAAKLESIQKYLREDTDIQLREPDRLRRLCNKKFGWKMRLASDGRKLAKERDLFRDREKKCQESILLFKNELQVLKKSLSELDQVSAHVDKELERKQIYQQGIHNDIEYKQIMLLHSINLLPFCVKCYNLLCTCSMCNAINNHFSFPWRQQKSASLAHILSSGGMTTPINRSYGGC